MTFAKFTKFEDLLDKSKTREQKQKHYISKFDQIFDLKRSSKLKSKIRESLDVFETLKCLKILLKIKSFSIFLIKSNLSINSILKLLLRKIKLLRLMTSKTRNSKLFLISLICNWIALLKCKLNNIKNAKMRSSSSSSSSFLKIKKHWVKTRLAFQANSSIFLYQISLISFLTRLYSRKNVTRNFMTQTKKKNVFASRI